MWTNIAPILGILVICFTVAEMFQDLFHPTRTGTLSSWIARGLFRLLRFRPGPLAFAGPLTVVTVIFTWAISLAIGFALIYLVYMPGGFDFKLKDSPQQGFGTALYYSLEMLTTLGLGEITPKSTFLRLLSGFHTLLGFSLLTSAISSVILLYPALSRLRTLARRAFLLVDASESTGIAVVDGEGAVMLVDLCNEIVRTHADLVHFPILFYFYTENRKASLPHALAQIARVAGASRREECSPDIRLGGERIHRALGDMVQMLRRFVDAREGEDRDQIIERLIRIHEPEHFTKGTA